MPFRVLRADFLRTAVKRQDWPPPPDAPEFAFVGRSNVGKSSMLNALSRKSGLARVSNTPGAPVPSSSSSSRSSPPVHAR